MTLVLRAVAAGVFLLAAASTYAQAPGPQPIAVPGDAPWFHANSGMTLPVTLAGFPRTQVREYEAPQLDVIGTWQRGDEELSVYVYRSTAGSVPVWFDRAIWAIEGRGLYGKITPAQLPAAVPAPGAGSDAGLIASWTTEGRYRGTGVAILPVGEWLVKLRYSSGTQDGAGAAQLLRNAIAGLGWPATIPEAPGAMPIQPCPDGLRFRGKAKNAAREGSANLLGALLGSMADRRTGKERTPAHWCRDPVKLAAGGVYRAAAATDSYLLALSDAGRGVSVFPDVANLLMNKGKAPASWAVNLVLPGRTLNYPPQDRLPAPDHVLAMLNGNLLTSATTWGERTQVNVTPGALN